MRVQKSKKPGSCRALLSCAEAVTTYNAANAALSVALGRIATDSLAMSGL